jgi:hypothetical protein
VYDGLLYYVAKGLEVQRVEGPAVVGRKRQTPKFHAEECIALELRKMKLLYLPDQPFDARLATVDFGLIPQFRPDFLICASALPQS